MGGAFRLLLPLTLTLHDCRAWSHSALLSVLWVPKQIFPPMSWVSGCTGFSKTWTLADYKGGEGLKADIYQEGSPEKMEIIKILGGYFKDVVRFT